MKGLTSNELAVYQSLVSGGMDPEDAYEEALDGVDIESARRYNRSKRDQD